MIYMFLSNNFLSGDINSSNLSCYYCQSIHGKCSRIWNTFLFLFLNKMLVFRARIHKMLVRMSNREDSDQTASSEAV